MPPNDVKHTLSPFRKKVSVSIMSRRESFVILKVDVSCSSRKIRQKHMMLTRKNHLDKWCDRCRFTRKEGECVFKNLSDSHSVAGQHDVVVTEEQRMLMFFCVEAYRIFCLEIFLFVRSHIL